jgi:hypothetical protein
MSTNLSRKLKGFWAGDTWDMSECPLINKKGTNLLTIQFTGLPLSMCIEIKYACWVKFKEGKWNPNALSNLRRINTIINTIIEADVNALSILDKDISEWEPIICSRLIKNSEGKKTSMSRFDRSQKKTDVLFFISYIFHISSDISDNTRCS